MSAAAPAFAADPPSPARALVERQLGLLTRLADIGLELAEVAGRRALAALEGEAEAGAGPDPILAYDRAARAVRMTIALQARLLADLPGLDKAENRARSENTHARVNRIQRLVDRALQADGVQNWRLSQSLRERLRDRDDYGPLLKLPLREAVAFICKDLGLSLDWSDLLTEGWDENPDEPLPPQAPPPTPLGDGGGGPRFCVVEGAEGRYRPP